MNITKDKYILAIRIEINRPTLLLQRKSSETWNNSFAKKIPKLIKENTNTQYVLNAYVATMYCNSYRAKVEKLMTHEFKRIHKDHQQENIDVIRMISNLGNALLNLQQMSSQHVAHIFLSLPLNYSSRKYILMIKDSTMTVY